MYIIKRPKNKREQQQQTTFQAVHREKRKKIKAQLSENSPTQALALFHLLRVCVCVCVSSF